MIANALQTLRRRVRPLVPDAIVHRIRGKSSTQENAAIIQQPASPEVKAAFCHIAHYDPSSDMNGAKMRLIEIAAASQRLGVEFFHIRTTDYSVYSFDSDGKFKRSRISAKELCSRDGILGVIFAWAWIFEHREKILENLGFTKRRPLLIYDSIDFLPLRTQREYESTLMQQRTVNLSLDQELTCVRNADLTLAVTEEERVHFEQLGARATMVLGYAQSDIKVRPRSSTRVAGFFGSNNTANMYSAFRSAAVAKLSGRFSKFIVAGTVCSYGEEVEYFRDVFGWDWLEIHGHARTVSSYCELIDVSVHIFAFGSGIKIKNVETISHGVPLITNRIGAEGILVDDGAGMWVVETLSEFDRAADQAMKLHSSSNASANRLLNNFEAQVSALIDRARW